MTIYYLALLSPNSDSKTVCNYIHLLLHLYQLQRLIVKDILDHIIKKKEKIYFDSG